MSTFFPFALGLLMALLTGFSLPSSSQRKQQALLEAEVDKLMARYAKPYEPGIALSIIQDGIVVYSKGRGIANLEYDVPITSSTVFHVASLSKQFTVFAMLLLEK